MTDPTTIDPDEEPDRFLEAVFDTDGDGGTESSPARPRRPCVLCEASAKTPPVETSNRALHQVNHWLTIEPMCEEHDTLPVSASIQEAYEHGGGQFVERLVVEGVIDGEALHAAMTEE